MDIFKTVEIDCRDRKIIKQLHSNRNVTINIDISQREANILRGAGPGCNLPPDLFNIYIEQTIHELKKSV